jgi:hypothetical protein
LRGIMHFLGLFFLILSHHFMNDDAIVANQKSSKNKLSRP